MSDPTETRAASFFTPVRFGVLLALLVFAMFPQVILGIESFVARDFGFFAYPLAHFQQECFWRGELPFWNPYNNCGVPFLAQWNTMPLYPPSLIYLTLPLAWSLSFFCLLHLWFAGLGMFFLARRWTGLRRAEVSSAFGGVNVRPADGRLPNKEATATQAGNNFAAAFAGVAFAFNGFTLNLLMWPSHMATFAWMPWVVLAAELAWRDGGRKLFLAAMVGALQMLAGGPETILLTWLIVSALWLQQFVKGALASGTARTASGYQRAVLEAGAPPTRAAMLWRFPFVIALVIALSAAQLLPFLDLVAHAQRESGYTDLRWSMPGFGLANFLVPMAFGSTHTEGIFFQHGQYWTSSYYLGIGALWLALLALLCVRERRVWLLAGLAIIALLCALGENTPFYPLLRKLIPQLSFITYPVKFVMVVIFAAPLLAAFALANLERRPPARLESVNLSTSRAGGRRSEHESGGHCSGLNSRIFSLGAILLALIGGIVFWTQHAPMPGDDSHAALLNGISRAAFLLLTGVILFALARKSESPLLRFAPLVLILVAWLDVFTHEPKQNPTVPSSVYESNLVRTRLAMNPQPELGGSRAMLSPAAALELTRFAVSDPKNNFLAKRVGYCANANLLDAVPKVDGFFSLTPREFDGLLTTIYRATNGNWSGLEDFMGVAQTTAPDNVLAWQARINFLPLVTAGQKPFFVDDARRGSPFWNPNFDGSKLVFLPEQSSSLVTVSNQTDAKILNSKFSMQTVDAEVDAAEPSLVVVAQTYYHNWHAEIDGQPAPLLRANVAFQAVQVLAGRHQLHFFYRDRAFEIGAWIALPVWAACLVSLLVKRRRTSTTAQT